MWERSSTGANVSRRNALKLLVGAGAVAGLGSDAAAQNATPLRTGADDRALWLSLLQRIADPVLDAMAAGQLRARMPVEAKPQVLEERRKSTHLEAVGRLLCGMAPWLEHGPRSGPEGALRQRFADQARAGLALGADSQSSDYLRFGETSQSLVDAAFLALAILRAPVELWTQLPAGTKANLVRGFKAVRTIKPPENNWLLFSAMVEVALRFAGEDWQRERVDNALTKHAGWYVGDGLYGDGPQFHFDFYNSFVIQPFLLEILDRHAAEDPAWLAFKAKEDPRSLRYAAIEERLIAPDGSYPAIGRSITYRCGAFHHLAEMARRERLPETLTPGQVRSALTAVIRRTLLAPGTFDTTGWLQIGLCGHQPSLGETYISTGSLYLCSAAFLPLGLTGQSRFWSDPAADWTARQIWGGNDLPADHALSDAKA
jgi:hypothetical protein